MDVIQGPVCHRHGISGVGIDTSEVMFINLNASKADVRSDTPLSASSGDLLRAVLEHLGHNPRYFYYTNLICWNCEEPTTTDIKDCFPRLVNEINLVKPRLIILLGAKVSEFFLNKPSSKTRGGLFWNEDFNAYLLPTHAPGAILRAVGEKSKSSKDDRAQGYIYDFVRDLKKIKYVLDELEDGAKTATVTYEVVTSIERAQQVLDGLSSYGDVPVSLDVETDSPSIDEIDVLKDDLLSLAISTPDTTWVFPPEFTRGLNWPIEGIRWTFQNGCFDTQVVAKQCEVWLPIVEDTMLQSYSLDERQGVHGLKPLAREYLAAGFWEEDREKGKTKLRDLPKDVLYTYNAKDAAYTARLCVLFNRWQHEDNVLDMYRLLLIPLANVVNRAQYDGVSIDQKLLNAYAVKWGQRYLESEEQIQNYAFELGWPGPEPINLQSPKQLQKFLYGILALDGGPSTDQEHLEALRDKHPFVNKLLEFRHLSHIYDSYVLGSIKHLKNDGRFHPIPKQHGSKTGRISYTKNAVQTIPQVYDELYGGLRRIYVPDSEDDVIIEADYGKAEIWTAYGYSKDPQMLQDLLSGDYHTKVAAEAHSISEEEVTPDQRRDAKAITFGVMYAIGEKSLGEDLNVPTITARGYIRKFFKRFKYYSDKYQEIRRIVRNTGVYQTLTGRKRRFIPVGSDIRILKQAVNFPIQSTSGDMTQLAMIAIDKPLRKLGGRILFQVHDSIVCHVSKANFDASMKLIHDIMTSELIPGFTRIPVEIKVGKNWGVTKTVHDCIGKDGCFKDYKGVA